LQPFSYVALIWATLVGFLVFIAASGIYSFACERRLGGS
jgi:hypothetical protein